MDAWISIVGIVTASIGALYAGWRKGKSDDRQADIAAAEAIITGDTEKITTLLTDGTGSVVKAFQDVLATQKAMFDATLAERDRRLDQLQTYIDQVKSDAARRAELNEHRLRVALDGIRILIDQLSANGHAPAWTIPQELEQ